MAPDRQADIDRSHHCKRHHHDAEGADHQRAQLCVAHLSGKRIECGKFRVARTHEDDHHRDDHHRLEQQLAQIERGIEREQLAQAFERTQAREVRREAASGEAPATERERCGDGSEGRGHTNGHRNQQPVGNQRGAMERRKIVTERFFVAKRETPRKKMARRIEERTTEQRQGACGSPQHERSRQATRTRHLPFFARALESPLGWSKFSFLIIVSACSHRERRPCAVGYRRTIIDDRT